MPLGFDKIMVKRAKLRILYKTKTDNTGETTEYYLKNTKNTYKLKIADGEELLARSGADVTVSGTSIGNYIVSESNRNITLHSTGGEKQNFTGVQKIAIILTKAPGSAEYPIGNLQTVMKEVNKYYQEASYGQTSLQWDVYGWYDTDVAPAYNPVMEEFIFLAEPDVPAGKTYDIFMSVDKRQNFLGGLYFAFVNPAVFEPKIDGRWNPIVIHELAHAMGAGHSMFMSCGSKAIDFQTNCDRSADQDKFDSMSEKQYAEREGHINSIHKDYMGWMNNKIIDASKSGDYTINTFEFGNGPVAIKIPKQDEFGFGGSYYLEYRTPKGFDDTESMALQTVKGPQIRVYNGGYTTRLLDMTPGNYPADVALGEGMTFKDPFGVVITTKKVTDDSVTVNVAFLDELCKA